MRVRNKLLAIIVLLSAAFGASVGIYSLIRAPISRIRAEQSTLASLREAMLAESLEAGRLLWNPLGDEAAKFDKAIADTDAAFAAAGSLKALPGLNESVKGDYEAIMAIQPTLGEYRDQLRAQVEGLSTLISERFGDPNGTDMVRLALAASSMEKSQGSRAKGQIDLFLGALGIFTQDMNLSLGALGEEYATIDAEVGAIDARSSRIAALIVLLFLAAALFLAFRFTGRFALGVRRIADAISAVGGGDLRGSIGLDLRDEIGELSRDFDGFLEGLRRSLDSAKAVSTENVEAKRSLLLATASVLEDSDRIKYSSEDAKSLVEGMHGRAHGALDAVVNIGSKLDGLNEAIGRQSAMIEASSAAVAQMISSTDSVAMRIAGRRDSLSSLEGKIEEGNEKSNRTFELIAEVWKSVDSIEEISGMIADIASQTNLLALNAAIEAAQAGEAGAGFSVVAGEIGRLAEATSENSKKISSLLGGVVNLIGEISGSGASLSETFAENSRSYRELSSALEETMSDMDDLRSGGGSLSEALKGLTEVSRAVTEGSSSIHGSYRAIQEAMTGVEGDSSEATKRMGEIDSLIRGIFERLKEVERVSTQLGELGERLNADLEHFATR